METPAQAFVESVLIEAFNLRRDESPAMYSGMSPYRAVTFNEVEGALEGAIGTGISALLEDTSQRARMRDAGSEVLIIDILEVINLRWCSIWPFCRASGQSL